MKRNKSTDNPEHFPSFSQNKIDTASLKPSNSTLVFDKDLELIHFNSFVLNWDSLQFYLLIKTVCD